jgi:pimeloyl-ACP methyl ester carboxylesterase
MKPIYIISGLGTDRRVFRSLDFTGYDPVFIDWLVPVENEAIQDYAKRMASHITTPDPILIGLSFGGIMAQEVARHIATRKIILIASVRARRELPPYFRLSGNLGINRILPGIFLRKTNFLVNWFFGAETDEDKKVLKSILDDLDMRLVRWSIDRLLNWTGLAGAKNVLHIHGTKDHILPVRYVSCDIRIEGAGHLMCINRASEISGILRAHL